MKPSRRNQRVLYAQAIFSSSLLFSLVLARPAVAQGTAGGGTGVGSAAPSANTPAPGVSAGVPGIAPTQQPLTLADVVRIAVGNNSGLILAQQRLQQAQELINQVNAQNKPQIRADANNTYSSYPAFAPTLPALTVTNPTLPSGGQIPTIVDQAAGFSTAFIGGSNTVGAGAATGSTPAVGGNNPIGSGTGTVTPGTALPGVGTPGAVSPPPSTPSSPSTPSVTGTTLLAVPPIIVNYVADMRTLTQAPAQTAASVAALPQLTVKTQEEADAQPRQPGDGGTTAAGSSGARTAGTVTSPVASSGQRDTYAARIGASQLIDLFGLVPAARDAQGDVRSFYALDITRLQNETALAAKDLFFNVLLGQAEVATEQEQVNYAQENVRITQDRFAQGIVAQYDVLTAQTALATAQQQLIAAQDVDDLAQSNLNYLVGGNPDQALTLVSPPLPPLDAVIDLRQCTHLALRQRPELGQAGSNINEAQRLVKLAGDTLLPTLGVVGNLETTNVASVTAPRSYATVSAELAVPLDDAGATRSRVRSARLDVQTQELTQEQLLLSVSLEVRQAAINVRNAQAQIGAAQTAVTQAQTAVKLAYDRYQAGIGTFLDVLNSLAQLATSRLNLANGQYFYQTSLAQLVRDIGGR
jgi:outer membrane protein TolC